MKFPGLASNSTYANLATNQITNLSLHLYEGSGLTTNACIDLWQYTGTSWTEDTAKCNNIGWNSYTNNFTWNYINCSGWQTFNMTSMVATWKGSSTALDKGIMLKNYTSESSLSYRKDFLSTESGNKPYLTYDYNPVSYTTLTRGTSISGNIEQGGEYWYTFTAPECTRFTFETTGSIDTYGELYQGSTLLSDSSCDDAGEGHNFSITHSLVTGTEYRLKVRGYSTSTSGSYSVKVGEKAIIIVPGVMGTELELASAVDGFSEGTKVWPPYEENETPGLSSVSKLAKLQCDTGGNSVYSLRIRNTNNYGALNSYQTLYTQLANTYGSSRDVIFFGYDWRQPNSTSGTLLRSKVNEYDSVIIVAHSMGGLVTSHMLTNTAVRSKIDKVITLGTPYLGSLEMVPVMSHGELGAIDEAVSNMWAPLAWVAKELVLQPTLQAMAVNIPSLYELLPTKKFFSLDDRSYYSIWYLLGGDTPLDTFADTRIYLAAAIDNYNIDLFDAATSRNDSLWSGDTQITSSVNRYYIVGEGQDTSRTYTYNYNTGGYSTTSVTAGDGSVLSYSASMDDIYSSRSYFVTSNHNGLVQSNGSSGTPNIIGFVENLIDGSTTLTTGMRSSPNITP